ncbi:hypothetical protein FBT96_08220 [Rhodobacter capsulatus]|uniref:Uncharacterized protein n=1 Tax=Rhodobacter capsulatus TaxID=1061 RepID=A0A4U1JRV7_RHOCA|nr:hypothetical protein FBT96_08220 [Rhodobacter capsulatus]
MSSPQNRPAVVARKSLAILAVLVLSAAATRAEALVIGAGGGVGSCRSAGADHAAPTCPRA